MLAGLSANLPLTLAAIGLGGAANLVLSTCRNTITQAQPDDTRRGRTQAVLTVVVIGGPQAGTLTHGLAGSVIGPRPAICLGGLLTVVGVTLITATAPRLWRWQPSARQPAERGCRQNATGKRDRPPG